MALMQDSIKPAEYMRNVFAATLPPNTSFEDVKKEAFWAHVAAKFHPTDRVEVMDAEGTFFAELMIISCGRNWAKVSVLRFHELSETLPQAAAEATQKGSNSKLAEYEVDWTQATKARVVRLVDKEVIKENFPSKADAQKWLLSYVDGIVA